MRLHVGMLIPMCAIVGRLSLGIKKLLHRADIRGLCPLTTLSLLPPMGPSKWGTHAGSSWWSTLGKPRPMRPHRGVALLVSPMSWRLSSSRFSVPSSFLHMFRFLFFTRSASSSPDLFDALEPLVSGCGTIDGTVVDGSFPPPPLS